MDKVQNRVVLSVGANSGDRHGAVEEALKWLGELLQESRFSDIYETPPLGHCGSNYMNAVLAGTYCGDMVQLEQECKDYERRKGRDQEARRKNLVPIDVDIVLWNDSVLRPKDFKSNFFRIGYHQII